METIVGGGSVSAEIFERASAAFYFGGQTACKRLCLPGVFVACFFVIRHGDGRRKLLECERANAHAWIEGHRHDSQIAQLKGRFASPAGVEKARGSVNDDADSAET